MALVQGPNGAVAAWETDGQIYFAGVKPGEAAKSKNDTQAGSGNRGGHRRRTGGQPQG